MFRITLSTKKNSLQLRFDSGSVAMDRETLSPEDRNRVAESLKLRPMQFCMFLKALLGAEEMQRIMVHAIKAAKQVP